MAPETPTFVPNISSEGCRRRRRFGYQWMALAAASLVASLALRAWWLRGALVFLPTTVSAVGLLQAHRQTCVLRAREGTLEHDDFSTTRAPPGEIVDSRRVSAGITRDSLLIGLAAGALAAVTALFR